MSVSRFRDFFDGVATGSQAYAKVRDPSHASTEPATHPEAKPMRLGWFDGTVTGAQHLKDYYHHDEVSECNVSKWDAHAYETLCEKRAASKFQQFTIARKDA